MTNCPRCYEIKIITTSDFYELIINNGHHYDLTSQKNYSSKEEQINQKINDFIEYEKSILKIKNNFNKFEKYNISNKNLEKLISDFSKIINFVNKENTIKRKIIEIFIKNQTNNIEDNIYFEILKNNLINLFNYSLDKDLLNNLLLDYSDNKSDYINNLNTFISYYKDKEDISYIFKSFSENKQINSFKINLNNNKNEIIYLCNLGCKNFYYNFNKDDLNAKILYFNLDINYNIIKIYFINNSKYNSKSLLYFIGIIVEKDFKERIIMLSYNIEINKIEKIKTLSDYFNKIDAFDFFNNYNDIIFCGKNEDDIDYNKVFICENIFSNSPKNTRLFYNNYEPSTCCNIFTNIDLLVKDDKYIFFSTPDSLYIYSPIYKIEKKFKYYENNFLICLKGKLINNELYANLIFDSINYNLFLYLYDIKYYELISKIVLFNNLVIKEIIDEEIEVTGDINIDENGNIKIEFNYLNVQCYNRNMITELYSEYNDDISEFNNCDLKGEYIIKFSKNNYLIINEKITEK